MADYFPNGTWVFYDTYFHSLTICPVKEIDYDTPEWELEQDEAYKIQDNPDGSYDWYKMVLGGHAFEQKSYSYIWGAERGPKFKVFNVKVTSTRKLTANWTSSKASGSLTLEIKQDGQAILRYQPTSKSGFWTTVKSTYGSRIARPTSGGGVDLGVAVSSAALGKAGGAVVLGSVYVRDFDVLWERQYHLTAVGAGISIGVSPFPKTTNWHSVYLHPACRNWDGATVELFTQGADVLVISIGETVAARFSLPNNQEVSIEERSIIALSKPSISLDAGTVSVGKLVSAGAGKPYLGGRCC